MPEIIDLEVARENILNEVKDKPCLSVEAPSEKVLQNCTVENIRDAVEKKKLEDISRVSKILEFRFEDASLAFHLMLHGDFCWREDGKSEKNVVFALDFGDKAVLIKDWSRWMKVELHWPEKDIVSQMLESDYGPDPLSDKFDQDVLEEILSRRSRSGIKAILMDQSEISGIGNAYADEILWDSRIHPSSKCGAIGREGKLNQLHGSIKSVLNWGLEEVRDRAGGEDISEQDRDFMKVYRKSGQKCPRCEYMIASLKVNGRDTFVCEKCQIKY